MGTSVSETTAEIRIVTARVMANSRKSRPTTSPMKRRGIRTAISEIVREMMVKPICSEPFRAASIGESPISTYRAIFSIMTIASSTTNPAAIVRDISERLLRLNPSSHMTANVPTSDSGTATLGMIVAGILRKNTKITRTTRITASVSSNSTSWTDARIVVVRSVRMPTSTEDGSEACSFGSRARTLCTTLITLAPGCRWMLRMMAGVVLYQAPSFMFSGALSTVATSESRTAAPFLKATMRFLYSSGDFSWSLALMV